MKERVTLTIDKSVLQGVDRRVDGHTVKNRSHAVELLLVQAMGAGSVKKALILAGGKGTRLQPITYEIPKPLMPVHDKTLLEHLFDLFKRHGIRDVILSVGYKGDKIKEAIGNGRKFGVSVTYIEEDNPLGTAGPIKKARELLTDTFVVTNSDELKDIDLSDMYTFHRSHKGLVTIALTTVEDPSSYGVAELNGDQILRFVEKPKKGEAPSNLINSGLYMFEPEVIDYIKDGFTNLEQDVFPILAKEGKLMGYPFSGQWLNTGTLELYEQAIKEWKDLV